MSTDKENHDGTAAMIDAFGFTPCGGVNEPSFREAVTRFHKDKANEVKHTKEPWIVKMIYANFTGGRDDQLIPKIVDGDGLLVPITEENCRRIVACVNRLAPFTTEQIENGIDLIAQQQRITSLEQQLAEEKTKYSQLNQVATLYQKESERQNRELLDNHELSAKRWDAIINCARVDAQGCAGIDTQSKDNHSHKYHQVLNCSLGLFFLTFFDPLKQNG